MGQILGLNDEVVGAGFLLSEDVLVTCAHVVRGAGAGPGESVRLAFPHVPGAPQVAGHVLEEPWRSPEDDDVAIVRLSSTAAGVEGLPLGSAAGCRGHQVRSFGFPAQAPPGGHFGFGVAGDLLPATDGRGTHLQLTSANDLATGFSGGPVVDEVTGLVIGMLTEITAPDEHERGQGIAYVTPTQVLREVWPELVEQEVCPYRGLESFTAEQARWFEGREDAVRQVLANLAQQQRLLLLLGPSGSGKSSLVEAGVLPALAAGELPGSDRWLPVLARPRQDLLAELERAGLPGAITEGIIAAVTRKLAAEPSYQRVILIIDQFEELLTQPSTGPKRERRLAATDQITTAVNSHVELSVILIMRDDFYPQLAVLARMLEAAIPGLLNVPSTLSQRDLHDIITLPAQDMGAHFEHGLPEQIISDVLATTAEGAASGQAPVTVLPLLELTLSQLWQRRRDGYLTHDAYRRIGGVTGSLTTWCDTALNHMPPEHLPIAQRILTSLVRPADPRHHIPAIRAQVPLQELRELATDPGAVPNGDSATDEVLAALTRHRIITTHTPSISLLRNTPPALPVAELIHDALIRDWGTLREWVSQDHRFQEWLDRTRERRARWAQGTDPGDLLGGTALAEGLEWSQQRRLPGDIAAFLIASQEHQQAVIRRSRRLNMILASLLVVALLAAGAAFWEWGKVRGKGQETLSRQLATQSSALISANPDLASLLAIQAYRTSPTPESAESLQNAAALPLQRHLSGHTGAVYSVAFSPDGRTLATGSADHSVRLWDAATGKKRTTLTDHTRPVEAVAFSPDRHTLATGSADHTVRLRDMATGQARTTLHDHTDWSNSVAFAPDGRALATGSTDNSSHLLNVADGTTRTTLHGHTGTVQAVAFSPDAHTLATGNNDGTTQLWDVATGRKRTTLNGHNGTVLSVAFSPDGRTLATGSDDHTVCLWDTATGKKRATLNGHTDMVYSVAFSPDGRTLATGSADHTVRLWDTATGKKRATLNGHTDTVYSVAFSPDRHTLATGSKDTSVRLWDVAGKNLTPLTVHSNAVDSVAFSSDRHTLATASDNGLVQLWDVATRKKHTTLNGHNGTVFSVAFNHDGHTLATGNADHTAQLWDTATGKKRITLLGHSRPVQAVAFSPDGRTLATGSDDHTVCLWDTATGKKRTTLNGHTDTVYSVAFSPDRHTLATASADHTVYLWDMATRRTRSTLTAHTGDVYSVAFSPDGRTLATASADHTVRLWDTATGKKRTTLNGHTDTVYSVAFSPDRHTLATGSKDTSVRLWDVALPQPAKAIHKICQVVNRDLTQQERAAYLPDQSDPVCPPS